MKTYLKIVSFITVLIFTNCDAKKEKKNKVNEEKYVLEPKTIVNENKTIPLTENKEALKAYYKLPHIKEFYEWQNMEYEEYATSNYKKDFNNLSYEELRLLRNEIAARNGHLFKDGFLRGYFNKYKWYMPIFDVDTFAVSFNLEEKKIIEAIKIEEAKRKKKKTVNRSGLQLYNADLIVNTKQFNNIPSELMKDLNNQNFSIINANRSMPFFVYDNNAYQHIPHYITTDLYLFILHKYFSRFIEKFDENYLHKELYNILTTTSKEINNISNPNHQNSIEWAKMYSALASYAIGDSLAVCPEKYISIFNDEKDNIDAQLGKPKFISNGFVNYNELKPRGHYTKSNTLKKYFRGFKWMSLNGINLDNEEELKGFLTFAYVIKNNEKLHKKYKNYIQSYEKLAGKEDNLSISDIIKTVDTNKPLDSVLSNENIYLTKKHLRQLDKEKITQVFGKSFKTTEKNTKRIFFFSSTYSISGDIFSKLIHVNLPKSKRPFPRGLDVPAVFGNKTAQKIITTEYNDNTIWPEYDVRLKNLQNQFADFNNWDENYGFKGVQTALSAFAEKENYPNFMKTDNYNRKELSTSLSSWAHIKHDLILYQEKPFAAEGGQGGGPEPPEHYSYVEPNSVFWKSATELVNWLEKLSTKESTFNDELKRIKELGLLLKRVSEKQLNNGTITKEEYDELHYVGATVEYILLGLLETDYLPDREKSMGLIADVFINNGINLNVAVGHADDIYVVVPIKGEYNIARGSIFSYYEFKGKIHNDEEWRKRIENNELPDRPEWINPIINNIASPKGQMQYRYSGDEM